MTAKTVLQIENVNSRLVTADKGLLQFLHNRLRFRPKDYWHNAAYLAKRWDGWEDFFDDRTGKFATGILPEVQAALRVLKKQYAITDLRKPVHWAHQQVDDQFLNNWLPNDQDPITLHDFQPDFVNKAMQYNRGIVQGPTGCGKTFVLVSLLKALPPKTPTLFMTKSSSLVHQNWEEMKRWGVENLGRWYDEYKEPNYVMCVTVHPKTFHSIRNLLPKFKVLLVDEVHECASKVPLAAYRKMTSAYIRIGFSATPFRYYKKKIDDVHKWTVKSHFGSVFRTDTTESGYLTTKDLQSRNILSGSRCFFYPMDKPTLTYEPFQDAIKLGIEQNFYFHEIVKRLARSCAGRTLIIVERIEQGEYLSQLMPEASWIQGKNSLKEREPVINALKKGEKHIAIIMRPIITAGINIRIHDLINAAGGQAAHNLIQQMGRGLRTADDKEILRYHDFLFTNNDYLNRHSLWRIEVLRNEGHEVIVKDSLGF